MALGTKIFNAIVRLNNSLLIPTGAGANKVLTSDAEGNGTWKLPGEASVATAYRNAAQKLGKEKFTRIEIDKVINDPGSNLDVATNHCYTVPSDGYYHIDGQVEATIPAKTYFLAAIAINGVTVLLGIRLTISEEREDGSIVSGILLLKKGDKIELMGYNGGATEPNLLVELSTRNRLSVMRVGEGPVGPENKLVETSIAIAYRKAKQKIPDATYTTLKLDTVIKDPGSNISGANGTYVVPADGYYLASGNVYLSVATSTVVYAAIFRNGERIITGSEGLNTVNETVAASVSGILFAKKGEEIELRAYQHNTVAKEQETIVDVSGNILSVNRVGAGPEGPEGKEGKEGLGVKVSAYPGEFTVATNGKEESNAKATQVTVQIESTAEGATVEAKAGGNLVALHQRTIKEITSMTFIVPAGTKWLVQWVAGKETVVKFKVVTLT